MKVTIIKATKDTFWYAGMIGETMEVKDEPEESYGEWNYVLKDDASRMLAIGDVVRMTTYYVATNGPIELHLFAHKRKTAALEALARLGYRLKKVEENNG